MFPDSTCTCRYPVLRLLGVAAALALYITAGVFTGYPGRLVPFGAVLASIFPGMHAPAHNASTMCGVVCLGLGTHLGCIKGALLC